MAKPRSWWPLPTSMHWSSAGSPIDQHAQHNTTSVYTAAQVFPMLPEKLSTDLTSLSEGEDRAAVVTEMVVAADGSLGEGTIYRATVRNRAKLAYNSVAAWLDGKAGMPAKVAAVAGLAEQLRLQQRVSQAMKQLRYQHGALDLQAIEPRAIMSDGQILGLEQESKNCATELIEDFMIGANGVSARFLEQHHSPSLRRVVRSPKRWDRIVQVAASFGETLPSEPSARSAGGVLAQPTPGRSPAVSRLVFNDHQAVGRGRIRAGIAGRTSRSGIRAGGARLHPFDGAQPPISRSDHATAAQSGDCRRCRSLPQRRADLGQTLHRPGRRRQ